MKIAVVSQQTYGRLLARRLAANPEFEVFLLEGRRSPQEPQNEGGITYVPYRNFLNFIDLGESVELRLQTDAPNLKEELGDLFSLRADLLICTDTYDCPVQKLLRMGEIPHCGPFQRDVSLLGRILLLGPASHHLDSDADRKLWTQDAQAIERSLQQKTDNVDLRTVLRDFDQQSRQRYKNLLSVNGSEPIKPESTSKINDSRLSANH